jgi:carbon-monoxide dehydrogenase medium subunit
LKPPPFDYVAPASADEAVVALAEHGDDAKLLAGGQSLVPLLAFRLARPSVLVDLNRVSGLDDLVIEGDNLVVGAMTRQRSVERLSGLRERCPMIVEAVELIGHTAIRNRGTVGGSLAHADPAAEWTALALALDAEFDLIGPGGRRTVPAQDFFLTYFTTALAPGELLTQARFRLPNGRSGSCFIELARRHGDFALVGVGALVSLDADGGIAGARVALIGVGDRAVRAGAAEAILNGRQPTDELLAEAADAVDGEITPGGDIHASADYRRHIARVLTFRALGTALARARGNEGDAGAA